MSVSVKRLTGGKLQFGARRGEYFDIGSFPDLPGAVSGETVNTLDKFDLWYRTLCAILYNFASSGHPGGSMRIFQTYSSTQRSGRKACMAMPPSQATSRPAAT